jgi:D-alanine-D-alanine ligase
MSNKIKVGILFGGRSAEHEVSLLTAKSVVAAIDKAKYELILLGIDKQGRWHTFPPEAFLLRDARVETVQLPASNEEVSLLPYKKDSQILNIGEKEMWQAVDVVFPLVHGTNGEDGTIQGLLKLAQVPFVGAGVLGSAIGMDKDVTKRLLKEAGIPTARFIVLQREDKKRLSFLEVKQQLGTPFFIKPANAGSSVGISKVKVKDEFTKALDYAFQHDRKILIEEAIEGKEIDCGVLGNEVMQASVPGEVIHPGHEFFTYELKYSDIEHLIIPAAISKALVKKVQDISIKACQVLGCEGMARVELFMDNSNKIFVSEINTIPGFTKNSIYPRLWEASGMPYSDLIDTLIQLAIERYTKEVKLNETI